MVKPAKDMEMERDYEQFPDDAVGDVLWKMREGGDKLGVAREVEIGRASCRERV